MLAAKEREIRDLKDSVAKQQQYIADLEADYKVEIRIIIIDITNE